MAIFASTAAHRLALSLACAHIPVRALVLKSFRTDVVAQHRRL